MGVSQTCYVWYYSESVFCLCVLKIEIFIKLRRAERGQRCIKGLIGDKEEVFSACFGAELVSLRAGCCWSTPDLCQQDENKNRNNNKSWVWLQAGGVAGRGLCGCQHPAGNAQRRCPGSCWVILELLFCLCSLEQDTCFSHKQSYKLWCKQVSRERKSGAVMTATGSSARR